MSDARQPTPARARSRGPGCDRSRGASAQHATGLRVRTARAARLAALLLVGAGVVAPARGDDPDNCLLCHQYRGLSRLEPGSGRIRLFYVNPAYTHDLLGAHARLACTDCHARDEVAVVPHAAVSPVDCTRECHLSDPRRPERRFSHANVAQMLDRGAHSAAVLSQLAFAPGPLLNPGQSSCLYCHDEPVYRDPADVIPSLPSVPAAVRESGAFDRCDVCHLEQVPVDVAYYLRHVAARLQPARGTVELAQVCAVCHSDPAVIAAHHMTDGVASYVRSFHGKAALLGDGATANCLSCHVSRGENAHLMRVRGDPASSIHPTRVADSCRSTACHPGADPGFSAASVHLNLPEAYGTVEYLVAAAFILLTIVTFGPSCAIVVLELLQLVVARHRPGHDPLRRLAQRMLATPEGRRALTRFTVSQRVQHWVLAGLFTLLALTGFPLKFADRDWAQWTVELFGGSGTTRTIHHWAGLALILGFVVHVVYALGTLAARLRDGRPARTGGRLAGWLRAVADLPMWLGLVDLRKAVHLLAFLLFLRAEPPTFGRFSVKEKFEYIGVFWGTTLLGLTGLLMWGEQLASHFVSGRVLNIAAIAHTYEAFLAIIHVGVLHICNVVLLPGVFPLSPATITGRTPLSELVEGHGEFVREVARELGVVEAAAGADAPGASGAGGAHA